RTRPVVDVAGVRALFIAWPDREIADVLGVRGGDVQVRGAGVGRDAAAAGDPHLVLAAGGDLAITLEQAVERPPGRTGVGAPFGLVRHAVAAVGEIGVDVCDDVGLRRRVDADLTARRQRREDRVGCDVARHVVDVARPGHGWGTRIDGEPAR